MTPTPRRTHLPIRIPIPERARALGTFPLYVISVARPYSRLPARAFSSLASLYGPSLDKTSAVHRLSGLYTRYPQFRLRRLERRVPAVALRCAGLLRLHWLLASTTSLRFEPAAVALCLCAAICLSLLLLITRPVSILFRVRQTTLLLGHQLKISRYLDPCGSPLARHVLSS